MAKKTAANPFSSMLGQATVASSDSKAKKTVVPIINLDEELSKTLGTFITAKKDMKTAEGDMRTAEAPLIQLCIEKMDAMGLKGQFTHSFELKPIKGIAEPVKFISVDKWSVSQEPENIQALRDTLKDKFDEETEKTSTVMMKAEVMEDEELQKELVSLIGDKFAKFFENRITYKMKSGFNERIYKLAGNSNKLTQIKSIISQNKPFLK